MILTAVFNSFWVVLAVGYLSMILLLARCEQRFEENPPQHVPGAHVW